MRSKAVYTISGLLRHNPPAEERFNELGGWNALSTGLKDPSIALRRKVAFLIQSLFVHSSSAQEAIKHNQKAQESNIHNTLIESLSKKTAIPIGENGEIEEIDVDYSDKAINALVSILLKVGDNGENNNAFTKEQMEQLKLLLKELKEDDRIPTDLSQEEWSSFVKAVESA